MWVILLNIFLKAKFFETKYMHIWNLDQYNQITLQSGYNHLY